MKILKLFFKIKAQGQDPGNGTSETGWFTVTHHFVYKDMALDGKTGCSAMGRKACNLRFHLYWPGDKHFSKRNPIANHLISLATQLSLYEGCENNLGVQQKLQGMAMNQEGSE